MTNVTGLPIIPNLFLNAFHGIWLYCLTIQPRFSRKQTGLLCAATAAFLTSFQLYAIVLDHGWVFKSAVLCYALATISVDSVYVFLLSSWPKLKSAFLICAYTSLWTFMYTLEMRLTSAFFGNSQVASVLLRIGLNTAFLVLFERFFKNHFLRISASLESGFLMLFIVSLLVFLALTVLIIVNLAVVQNAFVALLVLLFAFTVASSVYVTLFRFIAQLQENDLLSSEKQAFIRQLQAIENAEQQVAIHRHDMRFHLASIREMLQSGDIDGAIKLIGGIDQKLSESRIERYCDDMTVNAVLSHYLQRARECGIQTEVDFMLPDALCIDPIDFTAMMANALDNAINACMKLPDPAKRQLRVASRLRAMYVLEIANTFAGTISFDKKGRPESTAEGHGTGTRSIAAFVDKSGALLDYSVEGNWFRLRIALNP